MHAALPLCKKLYPVGLPMAFFINTVHVILGMGGSKICPELFMKIHCVRKKVAPSKLIAITTANLYRFNLNFTHMK
jgi:hypothetical protein